MADDLVLDSLQRRMRAMHSLYYQAVDTMDLEHVNHFEREGVLPIAFSLFHNTNMEDALVHDDHRRAADLERRVAGTGRMTIDDHGKHRTVDEMVHQRIGDYDAFKDYQRAVFDRTEAWLDDLDPAELTRVLITRPFPPQIASTYSARVRRRRGHHRARRAPSAGSTSTACATWARSSSPAASSASAA